LRNAPTFQLPVALVGWLEHVHSAVPPWEGVGQVLVMGANKTEKSHIVDLIVVSDTIVFDFLVDGMSIFLWLQILKAEYLEV
jgi:hypothetical protein